MMTRRRIRLSESPLVARVVLLLLVCLALGFAACSRKKKAQTFQLQPSAVPAGAPFALALYQSLGAKLVPGHHVAWLNNGHVFGALVDDIRRAQSSIHVLIYIWDKGAASDRIVGAIVERANAGAACRILVDAFGSPNFEKDVKPRLTEVGCEVRVFRPLPGADKLARNHRKIVVIDGKVAVTGGFGIRDTWLGDGVHADGWRDSNVRFTGPAVADAQQAFAENWQEAGGVLLPPETFPAVDASGPVRAAFVSSTASPIVTRAERLTQLMIATARKRIWIANAYFVPSRGILDLLERKAKEGLDVRVLAPGKKSDSKTSFGAQQVEYDDLVEHGVRVWEYAPSMMHAKTMLVDDELVLVGSLNLDPLSLTKLEESALVVEDPGFAAELARSFTEDCKHAKELEAH